MTPAVAIRTATRAELGLVLDWAAAEGWNPGLDDAAPFWAADPEGTLLAEVEGEPVAAIAVANHSAAFAFLGLFLCRPDWRGRGIGTALWARGLGHAGGRTVGLDGVAAKEASYARAGFVRAGATVRWEGGIGGEDPVAAEGAIGPAEPGDLPALLALDARATGVDRPRFLAAWVAPGERRRTVVLRGPGGRATGFATARLCRAGTKVGPVVAPSSREALALLAAAAGPGRCIVDLLDGATDLARDLGRAGFGETFRTARMYRGPAPTGDGSLHAVATMELG